jgi:hypothetical protein
MKKEVILTIKNIDGRIKKIKCEFIRYFKNSRNELIKIIQLIMYLKNNNFNILQYINQFA